MEESDGAGSEGGLVDRVVDRERRRLAATGRRLLTKLDELRRDYPSADRMIEEVEPVVRAHRRFLEAIREVDWGRRREEITDQMRHMSRELDTPSILALRWETEGGTLVPDTDRPIWRVRREEPCLEVAAVAEAGLCAEIEGELEGVGYPIVFTHELEANHRAILRTVGWALVIAAGRRFADSEGGPKRLVARRNDETIAVEADLDEPASLVPEPREFGFRGGGDLLRRLDEFDQTDPVAHRVRWVEEAGRAPREVRVLRDKSGARLRVEIRRDLRRLRLIEQSASEVVRNRRHIFVDEAPSRIRDRLFASEAQLEKGIRALLDGRIDAGFRVVYERLEGEDGVRERGGGRPGFDTRELRDQGGARSGDKP